MAWGLLTTENKLQYNKCIYYSKTRDLGINTVIFDYTIKLFCVKRLPFIQRSHGDSDFFRFIFQMFTNTHKKCTKKYQYSY